MRGRAGRRVVEWLVQHMDLLFGVVGALIGAIATMSWKDISRTKDALEAMQESHNRDVLKLNREMAEIKGNYLERFSDLKDTLKTELSEHRLHQEQQFIRKADCPFIHSRSGEHEKS